MFTEYDIAIVNQSEKWLLIAIYYTSYYIFLLKPLFPMISSMINKHYSLFETIITQDSMMITKGIINTCQ